MTKENISIIFPGRFQPFHNCHYEVLTKILANNLSLYNIFLGVIINQRIIDNKSHDFIIQANEHHLPERNPFSIEERLLMLNSLRDGFPLEQRKRILISAIPRPEIDWEKICLIFPNKRYWIIPKENEKFDDDKECFFKNKNDLVIRIETSACVNGRVIREMINNKSDNIKTMLPEPIYQAIKRLKRN